MNLTTEYLNSAKTRLLYYKELGDKTFAQLSETDFHFQSNEECNSIALIIQHISGNMLSRWTDFLTSDGEKEWRNRDAEFENRQLSKLQLTGIWEEGWNCFMQTLDSLTPEDLLKTIYIRREPLPVIDAINRQLAHYPYHVGQIIHIAKMIKNADWQNLSIKRNQSVQFNKEMSVNASTK